jgi:hypothetical protein
MHKASFDGALIAQILIDDDTVEIQYKDKSQVKLTNNMVLLKTGQTQARLKDDKVSIKNGVQSLFTILDTHLQNFMMMKTVGSPAQHVVSPDDIVKLQQTRTTLQLLLEE